MLKKIFILLNLSYVSCFVSISNLPVLTRNNMNNKITMMQNPKLKETDFNLIDTDKSGSIDKTELLNYFGNNNLMISFFGSEIFSLKKKYIKKIL